MILCNSHLAAAVLQRSPQSPQRHRGGRSHSSPHRHRDTPRYRGAARSPSKQEEIRWEYVGKIIYIWAIFHGYVK